MNQLFKPRNLLVGLVALVIVAGIGLALDLRSHGLIWKVFYNTTGEENPLKQVYGFVGYLGNLTRRQPVTNADTPTDYPVQNHVGVNTFLEEEPEIAKRERQLQMIADAGIGWIRQQFRWDDIEIAGRGNFTDNRNGTAISAWDKYDNIVGLADKYKVNIIARLNSPPQWSQASGGLPGFSPPADTQDFVNYAVAVASRYKGRIHYYQVWNEPNLGHEWGDQPVNPEVYTEMLCRTYKALKNVDSSNMILSGALAPTIDLGGFNLSDTIFLQRMYDAGAANCFDILGAQGYGLFTGPTDQRMRIVSISYAHPLWLRDLMIANGDAHKPIWVGEMAWNPVPDDPAIANKQTYGQVTDEQAARYAVEAYQRARQEWPWMGVICYWFFKPADDHEKNQSQYYFRMVDPDFTPHPVYNAIKDYATHQ